LNELLKRKTMTIYPNSLPEENGETELPNRNTIQSINRAMDILQAFPVLGPEVSITSLANHLGLNKATICRILATLEAQGFITHTTEGRRYRLGVSLFELGAYYQSQLDVRRQALPFLQALSTKVNETAFLCVRDGNFVLCVERVDVQKDFEHFALRVGGRLPLHCGAAPRIILSEFEDQEIAHYAKQTGLPPTTPRSISTLEKLMEDVNKTRRLGYVLSDEDVTPGISSIGAPVRDYSGEVVAAISVSGMAGFFRDHLAELAQEVKRTAMLISENMGYRN
jgi:IclR family KDG regulon transcriptional repressor